MTTLSWARVHAAQVVVGAVAGEVGDHLDAEAVPIFLQQLGVALDVVVADEVHGVVAGDLRLQRADLLVDPADIEHVVAL